MILCLSGCRTQLLDSRALFADIKFGIGGCGDVARDAKHGTESIERVVAAIETEGELIEIRLQVLWADAVMNTAQPSFEVGEYEMNDWHELFGNLRDRHIPQWACGHSHAW